MADCASSTEISTRDEARAYYLRKLVAAHRIDCKGQRIKIVFEEIDTHTYSKEVPDINAIPGDQLVTRNRGGGRRECRQFCPDRARHMDQILPAISDFGTCVGGNGGSRATKVVHGPKMACGRHMKVVLRPGSEESSWYVVSAFPIDAEEYRKTTFSKSAKCP